METWDHAHCLPYFKRMENCLAAARRRPVPRARRAARARARAGQGPAVRRVLRRGPGGRLPAHRGRQRLPPGGLRGVRPQRAQRPAAVGGARVPAPGDGPPEPRGQDARATSPRSCSRATAPSASSTREAGRRGSETARAGEVILCGGAINSPQLLQLSGIGAADELRALGIDVVADLPGVGENLQDHLEVYIQHAATQPVTMAPYFAMKARPKVGLEWLLRKTGPGRDEPLRGGRLRALQRRRRLPEPDVPLPADRGALRRHAARGRRRARLPGPRRPDVLRRARHVQDHQQGPAHASRRCCSTTSRPTRTGASGSRRSA